MGTSPASVLAAVVAVSVLLPEERAVAEDFLEKLTRLRVASGEVKASLDYWSSLDELTIPLQELYEIVSKLNVFDLSMFQKTETKGYINHLLNMPVEELNLTVRTINYLREIKILYVGQLVQQTENQLLSTQNLGRKSLNEIKEALASRDFVLNMKVGDWKSPQ
jgi:DNA-directed RNA polymerase alpha subunit